MNTYIRKLWDSLKSSYWFIPLVMMALAVILWSGTSALDHSLSIRDKKAIAWLYLSDADTMRTLLLTIAGAIIGIVGVVFSIIMVPLSIAASQFGPRLLRTFLRDTGTQVSLGTFTATFIFCMAVLLQLSGKTEKPLAQISVNAALLLGLTSFGVLIYFINHVAVSIQAPILVATVSKELHTAIIHELPGSTSSGSNLHSEENNLIAPSPADPHYLVMAKATGYIQVRNDLRLLHLATKHNLVLKLLSQPGDFVVQGTPIVMIWPAAATDKVNETINSSFILGSQRTLVQDIIFGFNELVEVAIRALSPAINDPFTAMTCLDWIGSALCQVCTRSFPQPKLSDNYGHLRIIRSSVTFSDITNAAYNQIREYGRTSGAVTLRLMDTIKVVAQCAVTDEQRKSLLRHATLIERSCHLGLPEAADQQVVIECYQELKGILTKDYYSEKLL